MLQTQSQDWLLPYILAGEVGSWTVKVGRLLLAGGGGGLELRDRPASWSISLASR
jgi:hypothetical protein